MEAGTSDALKFHIPQGLSFLLLLSFASFGSSFLQASFLHIDD
jgi:hypothetical protein